MLSIARSVIKDSCLLVNESPFQKGALLYYNFQAYKEAILKLILLQGTLEANYALLISYQLWPGRLIRSK